jgi:phosphopantothenoylcysteine decarboxylase/phosphopantothenate--cysteine ligase
MKNAKEVVLGVSAGIAAYRSLDLVSRLRQDNFNVTVIMTKEAGEFVGALSFQALSGNKVYQDMFKEPQDWHIEHISLAERAGLIIVCPATANIIAKLACGICDDLLTCVVCASRAPVLIAPAMNDNMYNNKFVQENIKKLKAVGYKFIGPKFGTLACGRKAIGCLEDVDMIAKEAKKLIR